MHALRLAGGRFISKCVFYSIEEIGIREISAANTFAYAYVCLLRYVSNSIGRHLDDRAAQKAAPRFNCCFTLEKLWRGRKVVARLHKTRDHRGGDSTVIEVESKVLSLCFFNKNKKIKQTKFEPKFQDSRKI